jgi:hypothetical protein
MTRSVDAGLLTAMTGRINKKRYYIKFESPFNVQYTDGDTATFNGQSYTHADFTVGSIDWSKGSIRPVTITFQNVDADFRSLFLTNDPSGMTIDLFETDADSSTVAVRMFRAQFDNFEIKSKPAVLILRISRQILYAPNQSVNAAAGFTQLKPPGTYQFPNGVVILTRNDGRY